MWSALQGHCLEQALLGSCSLTYKVCNRNHFSTLVQLPLNSQTRPKALITPSVCYTDVILPLFTLLCYICHTCLCFWHFLLSWIAAEPPLDWWQKQWSYSIHLSMQAHRHRAAESQAMGASLECVCARLNQCCSIKGTSASATLVAANGNQMAHNHTNGSQIINI